MNKLRPNSNISKDEQLSLSMRIPAHWDSNYNILQFAVKFTIMGNSERVFRPVILGQLQLSLTSHSFPERRIRKTQISPF